MKLITYVINCLFSLVCITTIAMEQSLIGKKTTQTHVNFLLKNINEQVVHDNSNVMNMVRESDRSKEGKTFDGIDPKRPVIKLYAHYYAHY